MFKHSYRVALNANPELLRLINEKKHSKKYCQPSAAAVHHSPVLLTAAWKSSLQSSALPVPCQLAQSVSWLPQCWWEIELLFHECFRCADGKSSVRAHRGSLGLLQEGGSCLLSLNRLCSSPCSCSHLSSCLAHVWCSAAVTQLLFGSG